MTRARGAHLPSGSHCEISFRPSSRETFFVRCERLNGLNQQGAVQLPVDRRSKKIGKGRLRNLLHHFSHSQGGLLQP